MSLRGWTGCVLNSIMGSKLGLAKGNGTQRLVTDIMEEPSLSLRLVLDVSTAYSTPYLR